MRSFVILVISVLAIFILWRYPIVAPLKILVVFFHEASHALATIITGGKVHEMIVEVNQSGHVLSSGGSRFLIASAGYLGSLLWGVLIYSAASMSRYDKVIMVLLGGVLLLITGIFIKNGSGMLFGMGTGLVMMAAAYFLSHANNDILLRIIGISNMLYVPYDIYDDTIRRAGSIKSDATNIAEAFGGTTLMWGIIWVVISLLVVILCLVWTLRHPELHADEQPQHDMP